jgi:hypothetical protein
VDAVESLWKASLPALDNTGRFSQFKSSAVWSVKTSGQDPRLLSDRCLQLQLELFNNFFVRGIDLSID